MKTKRIIWGAVCATIFVVLATAVCIVWRKQACEWWPSILLGIAYYAACLTGVWCVIDAKIQGK